MDKRTGIGFGRFGVVPLVVVLGVVAAACGSGSSGTGAKAPAGAKENAATAQCYTWTYPTPSTTPAPCAVDAQGPGGGRIFYDAGSQQSWGRFLEVAPQNWNYLLDGKLYKCPGGFLTSSCAQPNGSTISEATGDYGKNNSGNTNEAGTGYPLCRQATKEAPGRTAIGDGRVNTEELYNNTTCTGGGTTTAITLAKGYRGGDLTDWYIPSEDELNALCEYKGRTSIGGFPSTEPYLSSSVYLVDSQGSSYPASRTRKFGGSNCAVGGEGVENSNLVRPIRAF